MSGSEGLERFVEAQAAVYADALRELREGRKRSHWMWFIFPQLRGLGSSGMAVRYGIESLDEAGLYLAHPLLGPRLVECTATVNEARALSAERIFGPVDAIKLRSSMTLFELAGGGPLFSLCLDRFFAAVRDRRTLDLIEARA